MGLWVGVGLLYQSQQMFNGLFFRYVLLNAFFLTIETNLSATGSYVTVVGIGHFSRAVDDTSHDTYLQALHILRGFLDALDGSAQIIKRAATARTGDILGLGELHAGGLENGIR